MSQNTFRILVTVMYVLTIVAFVATLLWPNQSGYVDLDDAADSLLKNIALAKPIQVIAVTLGGFGVLLLQLAAVIGLLLFQSWGRFVYGIYILANVILVLSVPYPILQLPWLQVVGYLIILLEGAILLAIWTEPLKSQFRGVSKEAL